MARFDSLEADYEHAMAILADEEHLSVQSRQMFIQPRAQPWPVHKDILDCWADEDNMCFGYGWY